MPCLICLDADGTPNDRFRAPSAPGVAAALDELRRRGPVRLVTNATSVAHRRLADVLMVGDDAEFDASGSVELGMQGVLVRTGKYRPGDEARFRPPPTAVIDSVADLPAWLRARPGE